MEKLHTNQAGGPGTGAPENAKKKRAPWLGALIGLAITGGPVAGAPENAKKKMPPWLAGLIGLAVIVGVYGILKLLIWTEVISIYYADDLNLILINMILGLGLNLITGITGQFSLGHAGFMAVGAYTTALVVLNTSGGMATPALWRWAPIPPRWWCLTPPAAWRAFLAASFWARCWPAFWGCWWESPPCG